MTSVEDYFFDDPGYARSQEAEPPHVQGFIELRPETAALSGIIKARVEMHSKPDEIHAEGEQ